MKIRPWRSVDPLSLHSVFAGITVKGGLLSPRSHEKHTPRPIMRRAQLSANQRSQWIDRLSGNLFLILAS